MNRNRPESSAASQLEPSAVTMASKAQEQSMEVASQGTNEGAGSSSQTPVQAAIVGSASTSPAPPMTPSSASAPLDGHNVQASSSPLPRLFSAETDQPEAAMGWLE